MPEPVPGPCFGRVVLAAVATLLVGAATECQTVLRIEGGDALSTPRSGHGGVEVGMLHVTHFESLDGMRLEMVGPHGEHDAFAFSVPDAIEDLESLGSTTVAPLSYGRWWSFGQYGEGKTSLDLVGPLTNDYLPSDLVEYATTTDEGLCAITIPWHAEDLDPTLSSLVGDALGDGLAAVIVDGFDRGMAPRLGAEQSLPDQAWFADFSASIRPDPDRNTQLLPDWNLDTSGAADHRMCIRSYFLFDGSIDWTPHGAGEVFQWIAGGWIPSVFRIGDCPGDRGMAITVCGRFDVTGEGDEVYAGSELVPAEPGGLAIRVDDVRAWMNRYPRIRVSCNNARPAIEDGVEEIFGSLLEPSFAAMASALTGSLPFGFEEARQSAEGLSLVIARTEEDPDLPLASWLGLCAPRQPTSGIYSNVLWEGEPRIPLSGTGAFKRSSQ